MDHGTPSWKYFLKYFESDSHGGKKYCLEGDRPVRKDVFFFVCACVYFDCSNLCHLSEMIFLGLPQKVSVLTLGCFLKHWKTDQPEEMNHVLLPSCHLSGDAKTDMSSIPNKNLMEIWWMGFHVGVLEVSVDVMASQLRNWGVMRVSSVRTFGSSIWMFWLWEVLEIFGSDWKWNVCLFFIGDRQKLRRTSGYG